MISTTTFIFVSVMIMYCFIWIFDLVSGSRYSINLIFVCIPRVLYWVALFVIAIPYGLVVGMYKHIKNNEKFAYREYHFCLRIPIYKKPLKSIVRKKRNTKKYNWLQRRFAFYALRRLPMNTAYSYRKIIKSSKWKF